MTETKEEGSVGRYLEVTHWFVFTFGAVLGSCRFQTEKTGKDFRMMKQFP